MRIAIAAVIAIATVFPAAGLDLGARDVLVPIAGRVAGANNTLWRTDLVVTNVTTPPAPVNAFLEFHSNEGGTIWESVPLQPRQSLVLNDVLLSRFGIGAGTGFIRVTTNNVNAKVTARARIYNAGSIHGEFGQGVAGLPTDALMRTHFVAALTGIDGNRTNFGITNPWKVDTQALLTLYDKDGAERVTKTVQVPQERVVQLNDIFGWFGDAPAEGATVQVVAEIPVYAWASVVRNDSGDSTFIEGTGLAVGNELLAAPQCSAPSPVVLASPGSQSAGDWILMYHPGTNAVSVTQQLAARFGFTPKFVYEHAFQGFSSDLTAQQIASLRCESSVRLIQENVIAPMP
ncbi:MAG TPA: DUF5719 family protein [Thermoanaerobaculia bacterium]|jgi:hypothetical protein|nr:DUF5719 family protein [Thermoanaerobaculia bacterium]